MYDCSLRLWLEINGSLTTWLVDLGISRTHTISSQKKKKEEGIAYQRLASGESTWSLSEDPLRFRNEAKIVTRFGGWRTHKLPCRVQGTQLTTLLSAARSTSWSSSTSSWRSFSGWSWRRWGRSLEFHCLHSNCRCRRRSLPWLASALDRSFLQSLCILTNWIILERMLCTSFLITWLSTLVICPYEFLPWPMCSCAGSWLYTLVGPRWPIVCDTLISLRFSGEPIALFLPFFFSFPPNSEGSTRQVFAHIISG